ncbi:MAG: TetR/AcrR family transcriptional regulator [Sandaracinaceae bacterium]
MTTRRVRDRDKREALLRAARDVLVEQGYHEAKIDEIARRAGVAKGTYYLYFHDKRAIFAELVHGLVSRLEAAIVRVDETAELGAQVRHNIRATIAVLGEDPALARIVLGPTPGLDGAFHDAVVQMHERVVAVLAKALADGQSLGVVSEGPPDLLAAFAIGALKEAVLRSADLRPARREQIVTELARVLEQGFLRLPEGVALRT